MNYLFYQLYFKNKLVNNFYIFISLVFCMVEFDVI